MSLEIQKNEYMMRAKALIAKMGLSTDRSKEAEVVALLEFFKATLSPLANEFADRVLAVVAAEAKREADENAAVEKVIADAEKVIADAEAAEEKRKKKRAAIKKLVVVKKAPAKKKAPKKKVSSKKK